MAMRMICIQGFTHYPLRKH